METIELEYQDLLICDPCYIKGVEDGDVMRFDALKCVKTLHDGDDGQFPVELPGQTHYLGVDSGRIWVMQAEFGCKVKIDSGLSGHIIIRKSEKSDAWKMYKEGCKCCTPNNIDGGKVLAISRKINEWFGIDDFYFAYDIKEDRLEFTELGSWEGVSSTELARFCPFCGRKVEDIEKDFRAFSKLNSKRKEK